MINFCRNKRGSKTLKEKKSIVAVFLNEIYKTQSQMGQNARVSKVIYAGVIEKMRETYQKMNTEHEFEDEKITHHAKKNTNFKQKRYWWKRKTKTD